MNEGRRIADLIRSVYSGEPLSHGSGEAWHGPAITRILEGITAEQAAKRPPNGAHSIWELVTHVTGWNDVCVRRLAGETVEHPLNSEFDWPKAKQMGEAGWTQAKQKLKASVDRLAEAAAAATDETLAKPAVNRKFANYVMMHGILHHIVYHTGQIALLKKIVFSSEP